MARGNSHRDERRKRKFRENTWWKYHYSILIYPPHNMSSTQARLLSYLLRLDYYIYAEHQSAENTTNEMLMKMKLAYTRDCHQRGHRPTVARSLHHHLYVDAEMHARRRQEQKEEKQKTDNDIKDCVKMARSFICVYIWCLRDVNFCFITHYIIEKQKRVCVVSCVLVDWIWFGGVVNGCANSLWELEERIIRFECFFDE